MSFDIASLSRAGGRPENEDYADFLQTPETSCWVLADGLGGHRGGATASKAVVEAALASFRDRPEATPDAVRAHIGHAQAALLTLQAANASLAQMRSTIVILVSTPRDAVWAHVGDSRLYRLCGGQVVARTRDHSVSQALVDVGQVDVRDQGVHEDRSRLLRSLGKDDAEAGAAVSGPHALARDDAFLLCTDGFWEGLDDVAMAIDLAAAADASAWIERMEARLRRADRPIHDNYTATAIRLTNASLPDAPPHDPRQPPQIMPREADGRHPHDADAAAAAAPHNRAAWRARRVARSPIGAAIAIALIAAAIVLGLWRRDAITAWMARLLHRPAGAASASGAATPSTGLPTIPSDTPPSAPSKTSPSAPAPTATATPPAAASGAAKPASGVGAPVAPAGSGQEPDKPDADAPVAPTPPGGTETFADPAALPPGVLFRPAAGLRYGTLQAAIQAAAPGETIWIGPGELKEAIAPIGVSIMLKGAGRDATRLNLAGHRGLVLTGAGGGLEDLEICCAKGDAALEIGGDFRGTIARVRIRHQDGWGVIVRGAAAPTIADALVDDTGKGRINVREAATLTLR